MLPCILVEFRITIRSSERERKVEHTSLNILCDIKFLTVKGISLTKLHDAIGGWGGALASQFLLKLKTMQIKFVFLVSIFGNATELSSTITMISFQNKSKTSFFHFFLKLVYGQMFWKTL